MTEKVEYAKAHNLGGVMVWSIETDDFRGICGEKYPLLKTLNNLWQCNSSSTSTSTTPTKTTIPTKPTTPTKTSTPTETTTPTATTKPTSPPSKDICTREGYVRDPNDCSKFYYCLRVKDHYVVSKFQCPDGLLFDPVILTCNYPGAVQC